ncbi:MAG TPA: toast rack family protein [Candidatus Angelobacter sp.]|jgi:hypothetical protein|nr:toast rack family protein [Candidatus Angelobacter sp.]
MSEYRRGSMVGAILLIGLGVLFLIGNLRPGLDAWWILARYWPLLLIFIGLGKLWDYYQRRSNPDAANRRWLGGGEVAIILLVALFGIAFTAGRGHVGWSSGQHLHDVESIELPGAESAKIQVDMPAGHLDLSGGAAKAVEATFDYYQHEGKPTISHEVHGSQGDVSITQEGSHTHFLRSGGNDWTLHLNKDLPTDLRVNVGAGQGEFQLGGLALTGLELHMGAGQVNVDLRGDWKKDLDATIQGGVGQATIHLPSNVGVRVHATSGIGAVTTSGLEKRDDYYVNSAYGKSPVTLHLTIDKGVGAIELIADRASSSSNE